MANVSLGGEGLPFEASADLSSSQYHFIEQPTANASTGNILTATVPNAATDVPWGINQGKPESGQIDTCQTTGRSWLLVDANSSNIAIGDMIGTSNTGHGVLKDTDGQIYRCRALQAATADGVYIQVDLDEHGTIGP